MFSEEEKNRAIKAYIANNYNAKKTVEELGYPSAVALAKWYKAYNPPKKPKPKRKRRLYSKDEKQKAVDLYLKNSCNLKKTVRELGYGSATGVLKWCRERIPEQVSQPIPRNWKTDYAENVKRQAVLDLCSGEFSKKELSEKYGISGATLYEWKVQYIGKGDCVLKNKKKNATNISYATEIEELRQELDTVKKELFEAKQQLYRAHLEKDVYEKAAEILKKEMGDDLKDFSNREKAMVIEALRDKYPAKDILEIFDMAKSSYCYQQNRLHKQDKYLKLRERIIAIFQENKKRYGYRRIHIVLKNEGWKISEKIVRRIMKEECLKVHNVRQKKYSSYMGEISPAVPNEIHRDFHADKPNEKWLTDITEFNLGNEKVYLSPIIDCFDGLPVTWTVGVSPNAELVNTMLDQAIAQLDEESHPIVHSDRGCHYRWPGWIERMQKANLTRSMSKKGCSPDNSACEGFFGRMKNEMFYGYKWDNVTSKDFIQIVNDYMEWYREKRIKISLGGLSPMDYRRSLGLA